MNKNPKRPRDANKLAKTVVDIATGQRGNDKPEEKDPAAVALGKKGGEARAKSLTADERKEIAKKAAEKRWEE